MMDGMVAFGNLDVVSMCSENIRRAGGVLPDQVKETLLMSGAMTQEQIDEAIRRAKEQ